MKSVVYLTCSKLPCIGTSQAPIVICVSDDIELVDGWKTLPGFLVTAEQVVDDCQTDNFWRYNLAYDEALLVDPEVLLTSTNITGIFCEGCFSNWVRELVEQVIAGSGPFIP